MWLAWIILGGCEVEKLDTGTAPVPPWERDDDGDDHTADRDCDDADAAVHPDAPEVCDGVDQDCDGLLDDDAVDAPSWHLDADADGYPDREGIRSCDPIAGGADAGTDCDDADATVFPGAAESCDGDDDDCDGLIDEDAPADGTTWFADADADGYGSPGTGVVVCEAPGGHVRDATDCDDADPTAFPGAEETCDGADDDCDGVVDEDAADGSLWYADADADTYGDPATAARACEQPAGGTADGTDCDDADATVSPGADERCDGVDDDCDGTVDEADAVDAPSWYADGDADGYGADAAVARSCRAPLGYAAVAGDCDDADPAVSPGADELCDDLDQDCDGVADDAAIDAPAWYADADADGFGDVTVPVSACDEPAGYVADATDCDDRDATHHPGADEYCDAADDDCDGTIDEDAAVDAPTWYADRDGDAYGDAAATTRACALPAGYLADATDCDDTDAAVFPGADEYCDGRDEDCDGTVDEDAAVDALAWFADADSDGYGDVYASTRACAEPAGFVGDLSDCDDTNEFVNPARSETCSDGIDNNCDGDDDGCIQVGAMDLEAAYHARIVGSVSRDSVGWSVGHAGDVNGDGTPDLLVGVLGLDEVWLFHGVPFGELDTDDVAGAFVGTAHDLWGTAVAGVGDTDGDGYDDVLLGAPEVASAHGAAVLLPGTWDPIETEMDATRTFGGERANDLAGTAVTGAGDLDGDGLADLLVGAPRAAGTVAYSGAAYVIYGDTVTGALDLGSADGVIYGATSYADIGVAMAGVGDVDGDGLDDLLLGAPGDRTTAVLAGAAYLVLGPASGSRTTATAEASFLGEHFYDLAGSAVSGAGDTDGDGARELLVGAEYHDGGGTNSGGAYLLRGPFAGSTSLGAAAAEVTGGAAGDLAGWAVAGAGDFDQDGYDDWMVGAWHNAGGGYSAGSTSLLYGPGPWPADLDTADLVLRGSTSAQSGYALSGGAGAWGSGDLTGDGIDDLLVGAPQDAAPGTMTGAAYVVAGRGL